MIRQAPSLLETLKEFITTKLKFGHQSGIKEEDNRKNDSFQKNDLFEDSNQENNVLVSVSQLNKSFGFIEPKFSVCDVVEIKNTCFDLDHAPGCPEIM